MIKDYAYNTIAEEGLNAGQDELLPVDDVIDESLVNIYTADRMINVIYHDVNSNNSLVRILNMNGGLICSAELNKGALQFDASELSAGIYIVHLESDGRSYNKKISIY